MNRRRFIGPLLAAIAVIAGCKSQESANSGGMPGSPDGMQVVYIPKNTGNPYFDSVAKGLETECKSRNMVFHVNGPATAEATSQIPILKDEVQRGAKIVCITPNSVDALNATLDEIRAKGVKVIAIDADLTGNETHRDVAILPTDFDKLGEALIELLGKQIGYSGKFAILSATTDAPNQNHWIQGMNAALKKPKYARMQLVDTVYGDDQDQKSVTEAEGLLTKYPDLRGILAPTSVGIAAAAKVIEARGVYPGGKNARGKGVVVTGLGTPDLMRRYLKEGIVSHVALWNPEKMGQLAAGIGMGMGMGMLSGKPGTKLNVGDIGVREADAKGVFRIGPPLIFTKDNVDQFQF